MSKDVEVYCKQCRRCVVSKTKKVRSTNGMLAKRPREVLAIDFTLLEPSSSGIESALVLTDVFTKFTRVIPTKDQKACTVAKVLVKDWFMRFGVSTGTKDATSRALSSKNYAPIIVSPKIVRPHITHRATHMRRGSIGRYTIDCERCQTNRVKTGRIISWSSYTAINSIIVRHIRRLHTRPIT